MTGLVSFPSQDRQAFPSHIPHHHPSPSPSPFIPLHLNLPPLFPLHVFWRRMGRENMDEYHLLYRNRKRQALTCCLLPFLSLCPLWDRRAGCTLPPSPLLFIFVAILRGQPCHHLDRDSSSLLNCLPPSPSPFIPLPSPAFFPF